jgi:hypothetical protein
VRLLPSPYFFSPLLCSGKITKSLIDSFGFGFGFGFGCNAGAGLIFPVGGGCSLFWFLLMN